MHLNEYVEMNVRLQEELSGAWSSNNLASIIRQDQLVDANPSISEMINIQGM